LLQIIPAEAFKMLSCYTLIAICASTIGFAAAQSIDPNSVTISTRSEYSFSGAQLKGPLTIGQINGALPRPHNAP